MVYVTLVVVLLLVGFHCWLAVSRQDGSPSRDSSMSGLFLSLFHIVFSLWLLVFILLGYLGNIRF